jgi:hypothetical protein
LIISIAILDSGDLMVSEYEKLQFRSGNEFEKWIPEYVERLSQVDTEAFKIAIMQDNECFLFLYTVKGHQASEVEEWLNEQAGF